MFQVALYGVNELSTAIKGIIENQYNSVVANSAGGEPLKVIAYWDLSTHEETLRDDIPIVNFLQIRALYQMGIINGIIVPRELYLGHSSLIKQMAINGIDVQDIYLTQRIIDKEIRMDDWFTFLQPYLSTKYLPYLEYHIADHCNLNCKACEHYSGLVNEPHYPDLEKFSSDLCKLHEFIDDIGTIRILGGEPLLNPDIDKYLKLTRKVYPDAIIIVVTNALLIKSMPEHFYQVMREVDARIHISYYLPLKNKMPDILAFLQHKNIPCSVSPLLQNFEMKQTLKKSSTPDYFYRCFQAQCNNLYEGKIAACFLPFTTKYFNQYFHKNLPEDGAIDLYLTDLTTEILKANLMRPFERCCYCKEAISVKWQQINKPSVLSDWIAEEN